MFDFCLIHAFLGFPYYDILDIDEKNKLKRLSRKEELNEWKFWRRRYGMTEIDGDFCPKLDPWTIENMRIDEVVICIGSSKS